MYNLLKPPPGLTAGPPMKDSPPTSKPKQTRKIKSMLKSTESASNQMSASQSHDSMMSSSLGNQNERVVSQLGSQMESPKRPANAFLMFCDQYRQSIQNEYMRVSEHFGY